MTSELRLGSDGVTMLKPITHFWGAYRWLSNFYGTGRVEWRFQASKTFDPEEQEWVLFAISGGEAKRRGRNVTLRPDWEEVKEDVMLALLREKFADEGLAELLLATYPAELIEDATRWSDDYWGVVNGAGLNRLGVLLMQVRDELRAGTLPNSPPVATTVVHLRREAFDVRVDRTTRWGNPFRIGRDGTREEVVAKYEAWIATRPDLLADLPTLRGKRLGCWCAPLLCHGSVLARLADQVES